ncbi:MAG: YdcF family protein [Burkholderiales bacterium]
MIYLHKILPALLSPTVIGIVLLAILFFQGRHWKSLLALVAVAALITPVISNFAVRYIEKDWSPVTPEKTEKTDVIIVLSGMLKSGKNHEQLEWEDADRFLGGIDLFKEGKGDLLMFTRGLLPWSKNSLSEGEILKTRAIEFGIPEKYILLTDYAENTEQEAISARQTLPDTVRHVTLVTSAFHMNRAKLVFENAGLAVNPYPVDFKQNYDQITIMDLIPGSAGIDQWSWVCREIMGRMYYRIKLAL